METLAGKYLDSRFQDQVIFIIFIVPIDFNPLLYMTDLHYE